MCLATMACVYQDVLLILVLAVNSDPFQILQSYIHFYYSCLFSCVLV